MTRNLKLALLFVLSAGGGLGAANCSPLATVPCGKTRVLVRISSELASGNLVVDGGCTSAVCIIGTDSGGCSEWSAAWPLPQTDPGPSCVLTLKLGDGGSVNSVVPFVKSEHCDSIDTTIEAGLTSR